MTTIIIYETKNQYELLVSGHTQKKGEFPNRSCAAVSMLAQTLVATLENHEEEFDYYKAVIGPDAYIEILLRTDDDSFVKPLFEMTRTGFLMLQETYPENVKVIEGAEKKPI